MKIFLFFACIALTICSFSQVNKKALQSQKFAPEDPKPGTISGTVPKELLTDDSTYWSITTISSVNYVNTTPGPYYNTYKNGGGMIVKFKFRQDGTYEFMLYVQANTYNIENESWTHTLGTVEFTKDAFGQPVFITHATKGTYRMNRNGNVSSRPISADELNSTFSNTYLWEKTKLKDDPNNVYLLLLDLDKYPGIDLKHPEKIKPEWISKFHVPAE